MESGMMKVVLSSIINGSHKELPAAEAICGNRETVVKNQAEDYYQEKTSREVFASLVNASNCANYHMDREPDKYLTFATFTPGGKLIRKCR